MKNHFLLFIAASIIFHSCIPTRSIIIDKLNPAEVTFPGDVDDVMVLNASYYPGTDTMSANSIRLLDPKERYIVDTIVTNNLFDGFFSIIDQSPAEYLKQAPYYEARGTGTENFLEPLSNRTIQFLCDSFNVDAVISFEYYGMGLDMDTQGYVYDEDYYYIATMEMRRFLLWRIYDRDSGMFREDFLKDTLYWSGEGAFPTEAKRNLPDLTQVLREASWFAGYDYAQEITPSWSEEKRSYFQLTKKGVDISLDPEELKAIVNDGRKIRAYKASYNLALYYEMNDELDKAVQWINIAIYLRPSAEAPPFYKKQLKERIKEKEKLDEQLKE